MYIIAFSDREKLFKTPEEEQAIKKQQFELAEGAISRMAIDVEELLILEHYFGLLKCIVESQKPTYYKELLENAYIKMYNIYNKKEYLEESYKLEIINDRNNSNQYLIEIMRNDFSALGEVLNIFGDKIEDDLEALGDYIKYKCHSIVMEEYYIHSGDESNVNTQHIDVDVRVKYLHLQGIYAIYIERISLIKTIPSLLHSVWKKILSGEPFNDELNLLRLDLDEIKDSINQLYND
jgi:hypothetical protein